MKSSVLLALVASLALSGCVDIERKYPETNDPSSENQDSNSGGNGNNGSGSNSNNDSQGESSDNADNTDSNNNGSMGDDGGNNNSGSNNNGSTGNDNNNNGSTDNNNNDDSGSSSGTSDDNNQSTDNDSTDNDSDNSGSSTDTVNPLSEFTFPAPQDIITTQSLTLKFNDKGRMWLDLGSNANSSDIYNGSISGDQYTTPTLPDNLTQLHATLWTHANGQWEKKTYQWQVKFDTEEDNSNTQLAGQAIWEATCSNSSCHSQGASDGVFPSTSLTNKGIFSGQQLSNYIAQYMPLLNAGACDESCAQDVAQYITTWHTLPVKDNNTDNNTGGNDQTGTPVNPVVAEQCNTDTSVGYQAIRLLTRNQYQRSIEDLLAVNFDITAQLPVDLESGAFTNNNQLNVLDSAYVGYITVAKEIAQWSADRNFSGLLQCGSFNQSCATRFIDDKAWKIIRRPFSNDERERYLDMAKGDSTQGDVKQGIQLAISALLSSPQFLYRHEIGEPVSGLGNGVYKLTQFELASFLSYAFSGTTPDDALLQAAKNNQLLSDTQIENQVSRLLDTASAQSMMEELVHNWLGTDLILNQQKDASQFANFKQIAPHMMAELSKTFSHTMLDKNEKYQSLYNPGYAFLNQTLAQHYNLGGGNGNALQKVFTQERGGILLSGAFLSRWAHTDESNAVTRAVHVRRDMLCQDIPNPPSGVSLSLKDKEGELADFLEDPTTTQRMRFHRTTEFGTCSACHTEIINPLGFGLEDFNPVGVKRNQDVNGNTIDASGALWSPFLQLQYFDDPNRVQEKTDFNGGKELAQLLASDPQISGLAKSCLAKQMYSYVSGVDTRSLAKSDREDVTQLSATEKNAYTCDVMTLVDTLSNESPRRMLERMGSLESIRFRKAWSR